MRLGGPLFIAATLSVIAGHQLAGQPRDYGAQFVALGGGDSRLWREQLLRRPDVQAELRLTEGQQEKFTGIVEQYRKSHREAWNADRVGGQRGFDLERYTEHREKLAAAAKTFTTALSQLLSPQQLTRLDELSLQMRGLLALAEPSVAETLDLTEMQMLDFIDACRLHGQALFEQLEKDNREGQPKGAGPNILVIMREAYRRAEPALLAILTPSQQAKWRAMNGNEFVFVQDPENTLPIGPAAKYRYSHP